MNHVEAKLRSIEFKSLGEAYDWFNANAKATDLFGVSVYEFSRLRELLESRVRPSYKPCPHCGSGYVSITPQKHDWKDVVTDQWKSEQRFVIVCQTCGAHGPHSRQRDRAVSLWNRREQPHANH